MGCRLKYAHNWQEATHCVLSYARGSQKIGLSPLTKPDGGWRIYFGPKTCRRICFFSRWTAFTLSRTFESSYLYSYTICCATSMSAKGRFIVRKFLKMLTSRDSVDRLLIQELQITKSHKMMCLFVLCFRRAFIFASTRVGYVGVSIFVGSPPKGATLPKMGQWGRRTVLKEKIM